MQSENNSKQGTASDVAEVVSVLASGIDRCTRGKGDEQNSAYAPLTLYRIEYPIEQTSYIQEPAVCLIVQGSKRVLLGDEEYFYDKESYLITSVDLPVTAQILEASREKPYMGLILKFDRKQIAQMMLDDNIASSRASASDRGLAVSRLELPLARAFLRLVDLLDQPDDIPVLAPLIQQEIIYRLLTGEQGKRLQQVSMVGSHGHQIARAIDWLKTNYAKSFKVDDLAALSGMSTSSLHHHFRAMTAMSPLQFQKRLRLNGARQIMLMEQKDATTAAFEVGYESPSQFSREYSRLFGAPPSKDIKRLLKTTVN